MNKINSLIKKLESQMVTYKDLLSVTVKDNKEKFVVVDKEKIPNGYLSYQSGMGNGLKGKILVRRSVYERLQRVQSKLIKDNPTLSLFVTYGYRSLAIQIKSFMIQLKKSSIYFDNPWNLYEEVHRYIAVPSVAGHPTGGAIDVIIINIKTGFVLDFGSKQYDYSTKDCYVFSPNISKQANGNRQMLRNYMVEEKFAPFNGEWWHFSYGDREWAFYYKKPCAFYGQLDKEKIQTLWYD